MITVTKQENGVLFTFTNSDKYLYGSGTIEVPFNSLSIIQDESDNITLRKSVSNDIFLSARYDTDFGYASKEAAVEALKGMLYDEAGISEEEVQEMIDAATSGIPSSEVVEQLRTDVNTLSGDVQTNAANIADLVDTIDAKEEVIASALTQLNQDVAEIDAKEEVIASALTEVNLTLDNKLDASAYTPTDLSNYYTKSEVYNKQEVDTAYETAYQALTAHTANTTVHVTSAEKDAWNAKADASALTSIESAVTAVSNGLNTLSGAVIDNEYTVSQAINSLNNRVTAVESGGTGGGITSGEVQTMIDDSLDIYWTSAQTQTAIDGVSNALTAHTANTTVHATSAEKDVWNAKQDALSAGTGISISNNVISTSGVVMSQQVTQIVKLTQAAYDALATKDDSVLYVIVD